VCSLRDKDGKSEKKKDATVTTEMKPTPSADLDELIGDMA